MDHFASSEFVASARAPFHPVVCHRPHAAERAARWFAAHFPGHVFYAVKANPAPHIIDALVRGGVSHFDVASLPEIALVRRQAPGATLAYMHPVKPAEAIAKAYFDHGVRIFSLDSFAELEKIQSATGNAPDLTLCVRIQVDNTAAEMPLGKKFGAPAEIAIPLIRKTRTVSARLGVCFHVGSQTMTPAAYGAAMDRAEAMVVQSGVTVDVVDVGGGFPAAYPGMTPPALNLFAREIGPRFERFLASGTAELWCEPGRSLCAEAASLIVRVDGRRGRDLYINDGTYGMLYDAGHFAWNYPMRVLGGDGSRGSAPVGEFSFYGPTCDDTDHMPGPFLLPEDIEVGAYIEIGMLGAYGRAMATGFNGFGEYIDVTCADDPFGTVYTTQTSPLADVSLGHRI